MFAPGSMMRGGKRRMAGAVGVAEASTCSSITTASAPRGMGAPVMISQTVPRGSGPGGRLARAGCASNGERAMRGDLGGPAGEAVASRAGEGRLVASARSASASTRPSARSRRTRSTAGRTRATLAA